MHGVSLLVFTAAIVCCNCASITTNDLDNPDENVDVRDSAGTNFKLYTKSDTAGTTITAETLNANKHFSAHKETKFLVHGWRSSADHLDDIRTAYLKSGGDYNIVMVDWSVGAASNYVTARRMVITVGETVAGLISAMVKLGASTNNIQIAGHSLGAHIAGIASSKAGKVGRVIGMDPALPGFRTVAASGRLDKSSGHFVEVIHTDAGKLGWADALGHADFYPNGGKMLQPGCSVTSVGCSHSRANEFFAESITTSSGFWSAQCSNWSTFTAKKCAGHTEVLMGEKTPSSASGTFYLRTGRSSPFAQGKSGAS